MRVGVNYTPRTGWFHSWSQPDADAWRHDFEAIAGLGLDHLRVFPLWPLLQPNRTLIDPHAVDAVVQLVRTAAEFELGVSIDCLNGHLSSYDFLPSWLTSWHQRDLFTDPDAISGEASLISTLVSAVSGEPNLQGIGLGNEFLQFAAPRHPTASGVDVDGMDAWLTTLTTAARDAGAPRIDFSCDDNLWFVDRHPGTPRHAVTYGDVTTLHSWVFVQVGPIYGGDHPSLPAFPRYLLELAAGWSPDPTRPLWLQEFGAPRPTVSSEQAPSFLQSTVDAVRDTPGLTGLTWWCSHDVDRALADFPPLEYDLGLFTSDGVAKPEAHALAELVPELHATEVSADSRAHLSRPGVVVGGDWQTGVGRSSATPGTAAFDAWVDLWRDGVRAAVVPECLADRPDHLAALGVSELVRP